MVEWAFIDSFLMVSGRSAIGLWLCDYLIMADPHSVPVQNQGFCCGRLSKYVTTSC